MNKNAYEIRLDVLTMAREDLLNRFHQMLEAFRLASDDANKSSLFEAQFELIRDGYPTTEEINKRAEELYEFVNNSKE